VPRAGEQPVAVVLEQVSAQPEPHPVRRAEQTDPALEQPEFPGRRAAGGPVVIQHHGQGAEHGDAARDQMEQGLAQGEEPHRAEQRQDRDEGEDRRGPLDPASHAAEPVQP
jgi:hypothetical protein